jgi:predicted MFS family arabinose efflux permease
MNPPAQPEPASRPPPSAGRVLGVAMLAILAGSIMLRSVDPMIPQIAADLATDPARVTLLATAFALPYALVQPILGACADIFGKTRLMTISLVALVLAAFLSSLATSFTMLLILRIAAGMFAGGVFPISLAIAGDLVPVNQRQVAIGRLLSAAMIGNLIGSPGAGVVADLVGWRGGFAVMAAVGLVALVAALIEFRGVTTAPRPAAGLAGLPATYAAIFRNPLAKICYGAVLGEAICLFGLFPYVAVLLERGGESRASIAGLIIAGFGLGGIVYALAVGILLARLGERRLMIGGGVIMGLALMAVALRLPWQAEFVLFCFLGLGFYSLHGVIQIYATELLPAARGSTTALHSAFFFFGHALGPIVYGAGFAAVGLTATVICAGTMLIVIGIVCARYLRRPSSTFTPPA